MSLPAADDLFRSSGHPRRDGASATEMRAVPDQPEQPDPADAPTARRTSGRVRHDEKMTVYVTADELLDLEHARLSLRRDQGLAIDRGRLVREAIAIVLADLGERGDDSELVRRLLAR